MDTRIRGYDEFKGLANVLRLLLHVHGVPISKPYRMTQKSPATGLGEPATGGSRGKSAGK